MPYAGDELHHFGWNACSSALCPTAPHPHVERRYLVVPGLRSSRIYIVDTKPDPRQPRLVKVIEPEELAAQAGYSRPHTIHCGPDGIYVSALGAPDGDGPGGIFVLDHETFDVLGRWEVDRGPQYLAYDFWWHLGHDTMITSEWGTPEHGRGRRDPGAAAGGQVRPPAACLGPAQAPHLQTLDLGAEQQMVLELRPAHDPTQDVRLRRRGGLAEGSLGVDLGLVPRRTATGRSRRSSRFRPSRPTPTCCRRRSSRSARCRRW